MEIIILQNFEGTVQVLSCSVDAEKSEAVPVSNSLHVICFSSVDAHGIILCPQGSTVLQSPVLHQYARYANCNIRGHFLKLFLPSTLSALSEPVSFRQCTSGLSQLLLSASSASLSFTEETCLFQFCPQGFHVCSHVFNFQELSFMFSKFLKYKKTYSVEQIQD